MAERRTGPKEVVLLKRWKDWSDGIGHLVDEPRANGMYYASGLVGLRGDLNPGPFFRSLSVAGGTGLGTATLSWSMSSTDGAAVACAVEPDREVDVIIDAISDGKTAAAATLTFSHTCTGSNRVLYVLVTTDNIVPTGVTYAGTSMTLKVDADGGTSGNASIWELINPDTGANNIVVTVSPNDEIVAGGISYTEANQAVATGDTAEVSSTAMTAPTLQVIGALNGAAVGVCKTENVTITSNQTETFNDIQGTLVRGAGQRTTISVGGLTIQYFLEELAAGDSTNPQLYLMTGLSDGTAGKLLHKVSISRNIFAVLRAGVHKIPTGLPGQPAKYQTDWYIPSGADYAPAKLDAVVGGDVDVDTFTVGTTPFATGAGDHYANLNFQLIAAVNGAGVYILTLDGDPQTASDWGSAFQTGDKNTRPLAVKPVGGASFVLKNDGLFSFNDKGRSRLVFEDFRLSTSLEHMAMVPWFDGVVIGTPQGIFYYVPGERPLNIGFTGRTRSGIPLSGVTELLPGRFLGIATFGAFIFAIYQPDPTTTSALIIYAESFSDPRDSSLGWNVLGEITLDHTSRFAGIHVADSGFPYSAAVETVPTLWFGEQGSPRYIRLSPTGNPIKTRTIETRVNTSADAYMSEIMFPEPMDLTEIMVYIQDMTDGDEWQLSAYFDDEDTDVKFGTPFISNGKDDRKLDLKKVTRFMLHINWVGTSTSDRVPPTIKKIELFGRASSGR